MYGAVPYPLILMRIRLLTFQAWEAHWSLRTGKETLSFLSLLPTGMVSSFQPMGMGATASPILRDALRFDGTLAELVVCLDDELSDPSLVSEVLRMITNDAELHYSTSANDGTSIDLAIGSMRVDNMAESSSGRVCGHSAPESQNILQQQS